MIKRILFLLAFLFITTTTRAATITVQSATVAGFNGNSSYSYQVWVFSDSAWTDIAGNPHGAGSPSDKIFTQIVTGVAYNNSTKTLTIPAFSITSTTDALVNPNVRLYFWIFQVVGVNPTAVKAYPNTENGIKVPPSITSAFTCSSGSAPTCASFYDLIVYSQGAPSPPPPRFTYSDAQIDIKINAAVSSKGDASTNTSTSVDSELPLFSGTGGKTLKRASGTGIPKLTSGVVSLLTDPLPVTDGGTGVTAAVEINLKAAPYNAALDGVTSDDTPFNTAVAAIIAAGSGAILLPPNSTLLLTGILQSGSNSVIKFPARALSLQTVSIKIKTTAPPGVMAFASGAAPNAGAVIKCTTTGSGTLPAVFGVEASGGSFSNYSLEFENVTIRATHAAMGGINAKWAERLTPKNTAVDKGASPPIQPSGSAYGIIMPTVGNDVESLLDNVSITGFPTALLSSEHSNFRNLYLVRNTTGVEFSQGFHPNVGNIIFFQCPNPLKFTGRSVVDLTLAIENAQTLGNWYDPGIDIDDGAGNAHGIIRFKRTISNTGDVSGISATGLTNMQLYDLNASPGIYSYQSIVTTFKNLAGGVSNVYIDAAAGFNTNIAHRAAGLGVWYTGNTASDNSLHWINSDANSNAQVMTLTQAGSLTLGGSTNGVTALLVNNPSNGAAGISRVQLKNDASVSAYLSVFSSGFATTALRNAFNIAADQRMNLISGSGGMWLYSDGGTAPLLVLKANGRLAIPSLPTYADNAAALAGGLIADEVYRTATGQIMVVF